MARRINSVGLCAIIILCILLIFASHRMTFSPFSSSDLDTPAQLHHLNHLDEQRRPNNGKYFQIMYPRDYTNRKSNGLGPSSGELATAMTTSTIFNSTVRIEDVVNEQRQLILDEMKDFEYTEKTLNLGALTPETGGRPVQSGNYSFVIPFFVFFFAILPRMFYLMISVKHYML